MPDGGMITTATDLARLVDALLSGKLLSPPLLAAITTTKTPPSTDLEHYGDGLELVVENGVVTILGHGGADPGVSTMLPTNWPPPRQSSCRNQARGAGRHLFGSRMSSNDLSARGG
jgi:CubicO group peptidase (beta-lactamase class C family)